MVPKLIVVEVRIKQERLAFPQSRPLSSTFEFVRIFVRIDTEEFTYPLKFSSRLTFSSGLSRAPSEEFEFVRMFIRIDKSSNYPLVWHSALSPALSKSLNQIESIKEGSKTPFVCFSLQLSACDKSSKACSQRMVGIMLTRQGNQREKKSLVH